MAHWAELDSNNVVLRVLVGDNNDPAGDEGYQWLIDNLGGIWIKTSYNNSIRKQFAAPGFTYNVEGDVFVRPQVFASWTLDENYDWQAPIEYPTDGKDYSWDEELGDWVETLAE